MENKSKFGCVQSSSEKLGIHGDDHGADPDENEHFRELWPTVVLGT
jgi:hypothetical protein